MYSVRKFDMKSGTLPNSLQVEPSPAIRVLLQEDKLDPAAALARMAADPAFKQKLRLLQAEAWLLFNSAIEDVAETLPGARPDPASQQLPGAGASLSRLSRRAHNNAKDRLTLAKLLITAAVLNRHNRDWNPADVSTDKPALDDGLLLLMEMDLNK